jgi:subtilisin family serine protease
VNDSPKVDPLPGPDDDHGTVVAGVLGAVGGNGVGIVGVAPHVKMCAGARARGRRARRQRGAVLARLRRPLFDCRRLAARSPRPAPPSPAPPAPPARLSAKVMETAAVGAKGSERLGSFGHVWNAVKVGGAGLGRWGRALERAGGAAARYKPSFPSCRFRRHPSPTTHPILYLVTHSPCRQSSTSTPSRCWTT